jgi:hypothetical protein
MAEGLDLKKFVTSTPSSPVHNMPGEHHDDVESIPDADKLQEGQLPKGKDPSPFKLGPMAPGGR